MTRSKGKPVNNAYRKYMERLLESGRPCTFATHDPVLLDYAHEYIRAQDLDATGVEFSMLYGVTPERLETRRERGYDTRVYLPYGTEWYLYLCHRLAEYPPNIYRALADAITEIDD